MKKYVNGEYIDLTPEEIEKKKHEDGTEHSFNYSPDTLAGNYFKLVE